MGLFAFQCSDVQKIVLHNFLGQNGTAAVVAVVIIAEVQWKQ